MPKFKDWIAARTEATIAGDDELYVRDDSGDVSQRITFTDLAAAIGGGGGGAVTSVNGETGAVVLDADDIDDTSSTNKFATAAQLSAVDGLAATYQPLDADLTTLAGGGLPSNLEATLDAQYQPLTAVATVADTTDTLAAGDADTVILYTAAGAVTVDLANIATGFECVLVSLGAGGLNVDANGMSFANSFTPNLTVAQGEALYVRQTAASTFVVLGGTAA